MNEREEAKCPHCGTHVQLIPRQADYDSVIVTCPVCKQQFDHQPKSK